MTADQAEPDECALDWRSVAPDKRSAWWQQLWEDAIALDHRYRLGLRAPWWQDPIQVEALAALAAWTRAYDSGNWVDPVGKLTLLYDLDKIRGLLRAGDRPFNPQQDAGAFAERVRHKVPP